MHVRAGAQNPEEGIGSPCAGVSPVLGSEHRSSARPARVLNHCAISPVLGLRV